MKYSIYFMFCFLFSIALMSCSNAEPKEAVATTSSKMLVLDKDQFKSKLTNPSNAQLIDVRTLEEYAAGAIPNAINIDFYSDDFNAKMMKLNKERPVMVYCKSGGRSGKTAKMLQKAGFKEVYDLEGGYSNWSK